jgi:hypothetical protein
MQVSSFFFRSSRVFVGRPPRNQFLDYQLILPSALHRMGSLKLEEIAVGL